MKRTQRKRTNGWKMPDNTMYVGRPSKWGNPYTLDTWLPQEAVVQFEDELRSMSFNDLYTLLYPLFNKDLACWCSLDSPCHADVLIELCKELQETSVRVTAFREIEFGNKVEETVLIAHENGNVHKVAKAISGILGSNNG